MNHLTLAVRIALLAFTVASFLTLAGCGGGGSEDEGLNAKPSTGALPRQQVQP